MQHRSYIFPLRWLLLLTAAALLTASQSILTPQALSSQVDFPAQLATLGCDQVPTNPVLHDLSPAYPLAFCVRKTAPLSTDGIFQAVGCMWPGYASYAVLQQHRPRFIRGERDFQAVYAPIESPAEAVSYAVAITGFLPTYPIYERSTANPKRVEQHMLPGSVTMSDTGYVVQLYEEDGPRCGCATRTVWRVTLDVPHIGRLQEIGRDDLMSTKACND